MIKTSLTSFIKAKQFEDALKYLDNLPQALQKEFVMENAYILHRNGNNKKALTKLQTLKDDTSYQYQHLLAQINYKLGKYDQSVSIYEGILNSNTQGIEGEEPLDQDEITDITTNYLACQSSVQKSSQQDVKKFLQQYCSDSGFEQTYEYFFNLS